MGLKLIEDIVRHLLIEGVSTLEYISSFTGLSEDTIALNLSKLKGISIENNVIKVVNKTELVLSAIELGVKASTVSNFITWKEFEQELFTIIDTSGFYVTRNFRIYKPYRLEIDVLAIKSGKVLVLEAKHWSQKSSNRSRISSIADSHYRRVEKLVRCKTFLDVLKERACAFPSCKAKVFPVVVTLFGKPLLSSMHVPIVPINYLKSFISDFDSLSEDIAKFEIDFESD